MAAWKKDARTTLSHCRYTALFFLLYFVLLLSVAHSGKHHHNQGGMEKLLAAGLIAKALAKGGEEGGGGGGGEARHHYMPIPVPLHSGGGGGGSHHHHVHHKYVPIPVKHHTNFIIAHHKVHVPVHVPVPVVKTKIVHVPVEKTKIVPIIVHKGHHDHPHYSPYSERSNFKKGGSTQHISASTASRLTALASAASAQEGGTRQLRITSLGTVRKLKEGARNGTSPTAIQFKTPSSRSPEKWIVVVKNKRRPSNPIRRHHHVVVDNMTADTKVIPRIAVANSTAISTAGPR